MRYLRRYALAACLACGLLGPPPEVRADEGKEYLVKAAFLYNFVKFVEWPNEKATTKLSSIDICAIGDGPIVHTSNVFKAASTEKLKLALVEEKDARQAATHCHILFIDRSQEGRLNEILAALKGHPVLTVSDIDDFAGRGGMIGFVTSDGKIKLEVNTRPATAAGMRIDPQLLEIALKVIDR